MIYDTTNYMGINIIYEDNHLLIVEKPANLPVQADASGDKDLLNILKRYLVESCKKPGEAYLGLVHRLDRPTGGVMAFAKTSKASQKICEQIKGGEFEKRYLAVVEGVPRDSSKKLINYLKKFPDNIVRVVPALSEDAKYAELDYKVLAVTADRKRSLLQVDLQTGRTHQIRVQLATMGNPIVGDVKYGKPNGKKDDMTKNLALWAMQLRLLQPVSKQPMVFRAYPPEIEPWTQFDIDSLLKININNSYWQSSEDKASVSLQKIGDLDLDLVEDDKEE